MKRLKTGVRRTLSILLTLALCVGLFPLSVLPVQAAPSLTVFTYGKPVISDRTYNVNGKSYTLIKGTYRFPSAVPANGRGTDLDAVFYYSDGFFAEDNYVYNTHLATTSLNMAMSAFYANEGGSGPSGNYGIKSQNIGQFLMDIGCEKQNIYMNGFNKTRPQTDSIGVTIGQKKLKTADGKETNRILVPIAIRGANYEKEWASNVTLGSQRENGGEAKGFSTAAQIVKSEVDQYIENYGLKKAVEEGRVDFWISGYSRAGATTNLTARRLVDSYSPRKGSGNRVFAYCNEAPQGGWESAKTAGNNYDCIHSVINKTDLVPRVAPSFMGFKRYGVDHFIPGTAAGASNGVSDNTEYAVGSASYQSLKPRMMNQLKILNPYIKFDDSFQGYGLNTAILKAATHTLSVNPVNWIKASYHYGAATLRAAKGYQAVITKLPKPLSMDAYLDDFFKYLGEWSGVTRDSYMAPTQINSIENAARNMMAMAFDSTFEELNLFKDSVVALWGGTTHFYDLLFLIYGGLSSYHKMSEEHRLVIANQLIDWIDSTKVLNKLNLKPEEADRMKKKDLPTLCRFLLTFLSRDYDKGTYGTDGMEQILTFAANVGNIMSNHFPEVNLAWLRVQDSLYDNETTTPEVNMPVMDEKILVTLDGRTMNTKDEYDVAVESVRNGKKLLITVPDGQLYASNYSVRFSNQSLPAGDATPLINGGSYAQITNLSGTGKYEMIVSWTYRNDKYENRYKLNVKNKVLTLKTQYNDGTQNILIKENKIDGSDVIDFAKVNVPVPAGKAFDYWNVEYIHNNEQLSKHLYKKDSKLYLERDIPDGSAITATAFFKSDSSKGTIKLNVKSTTPDRWEKITETPDTVQGPAVEVVLTDGAMGIYPAKTWQKNADGTFTCEVTLYKTTTCFFDNRSYMKEVKVDKEFQPVVGIEQFGISGEDDMELVSNATIADKEGSTGQLLIRFTLKKKNALSGADEEGYETGEEVPEDNTMNEADGDEGFFAEEDFSLAIDAAEDEEADFDDNETDSYDEGPVEVFDAEEADDQPDAQTPDGMVTEEFDAAQYVLDEGAEILVNEGYVEQADEEPHAEASSVPEDYEASLNEQSAEVEAGIEDEDGYIGTSEEAGEWAEELEELEDDPSDDGFTEEDPVIAGDSAESELRTVTVIARNMLTKGEKEFTCEGHEYIVAPEWLGMEFYRWADGGDSYDEMYNELHYLDEEESPVYYADYFPIISKIEIQVDAPATGMLLPTSVKSFILTMENPDDSTLAVDPEYVGLDWIPYPDMLYEINEEMYFSAANPKTAYTAEFYFEDGDEVTELLQDLPVRENLPIVVNDGINGQIVVDGGTGTSDVIFAEFPETGSEEETPAKEISTIFFPDDVILPHGAAVDSAVLPEKALVQYSDESVGEISVNWDLESAECYMYDRSKGIWEEVSYQTAMESEDSVELFVNGEAGGQGTSISIYLAGQEILPAPLASCASGQVSKDGSVILRGTSDDSEIYYTLDGSDPKVSETAEQYEAPISFSELASEAEVVLTAYEKSKDPALYSGSENSVWFYEVHNLEKVDGVPASCTAKGTKEHWKCKECGLIFADAACTEFLSEEDVVLQPAGHKPETSVAKASLDKPGSIVTACSVCGAEISRETVAAIASISLEQTSFVYDGKAKTPAAVVKDTAGKVLGSDSVTVAYSDNIEAGTAKAAVTLKGSYEGRKELGFTITKADNPLTVKVGSKTYKRSKLGKKKSFKIGAANAQGKVTYAISKNAKKAGIKVSKKGKVTVPKNCRKGTYKITVKAAGSKNYKEGIKTVTVKVK